jgi:hypothetical protein
MNNKLTSGQSSSSSTMAFGPWISTTTKIDSKNLVTSLYLAYVLIDLFYHLKIAFAMVNMAMVGHFVPNSRTKLQTNDLP